MNSRRAFGVLAKVRHLGLEVVEHLACDIDHRFHAAGLYLVFFLYPARVANSSGML
jgi:hypothetical protein